MLILSDHEYISDVLPPVELYLVLVPLEAVQTVREVVRVSAEEESRVTWQQSQLNIFDGRGGGGGGNLLSQCRMAHYVVLA